jgi:hypothetical protein
MSRKKNPKKTKKKDPYKRAGIRPGIPVVGAGREGSL